MIDRQPLPVQSISTDDDILRAAQAIARTNVIVTGGAFTPLLRIIGEQKEDLRQYEDIRRAASALVEGSELVESGMVLVRREDLRWLRQTIKSLEQPSAQLRKKKQ